MKTLFVTGAEGFCGRYLVELLQKSNYEVVGGVRNRARKLAFEKRNGKALVCDVSDAINVARCIASVKPDGVIHLASTSHADAAEDEPLTAYQSIVTAWANVLDAVRRATPRARTLLVSACDVYGNAGAGGQPIREDQPPQPGNTFGSLKSAAESIAQTFFRKYHLDLMIARPFPFAGPGQNESCFFPTVARRISQWNAATDGDHLPIPNAESKRDLLHVRDVAQALKHLIEEGKPNETYNVSSGQSWTMRQLCEWIAQQCDKNIRFTSTATPSETPVDCLCGDNSKLTQNTNWRPAHTPQQTIADMLTAVGSTTHAAHV